MITIYKDKRKTNKLNPKDFYGKRKEMFIAEEKGQEGFGNTEEQAIQNLKKIKQFKRLCG